MNKWLCTAIIIVVIVVAYILCRSGVLVSKSIRAILFVFRRGKRSERISLDSCTGWVSHAVHFRDGGTYEFVLDSHVSKGIAEIRLEERGNQALLLLTAQSPAGRVELNAKQRCRLRWDFKSATGKCELRWRRMDAGLPSVEASV